MKKLVKITVILVLIMSVFGCDLFKNPEALIVSRIEDFENDLNSGDYSRLQANFHPDMPSYDTYNDLEVLTSGSLQPANGPFSLGTPGSTETSSGYTATGTFNSDVASDFQYIADMRETGDDWKIYSISFTNGTSTYEIRTLK